MACLADSAARTLLRIQTLREKQEAALHPPRWSASAANSRRSRSSPPHRPLPPSPHPPPAPAAAGIDAEVARYAVLYPDRAARIRAAGGLQADLDFGGRVPRSSLACCAPPIRPSPGQRDGRAIPAGATASSQRRQ